MTRSIEEIRAELREAEALDAEARKAKRESTPVVRRFTIKPHEPRHFVEEMYDSDCLLYMIKAEVVNLEEAKTAGHPEHDLRAGGMVYVYNTMTGKIVCGVGGGTIWISQSLNGENKRSAFMAMGKIGEFLGEHPEGGDITDIVNEHRNGSE